MTLQTLRQTAAERSAHFLDLWRKYAKNGRKSGTNSTCGLAALYRKELADHLHSKRFILIFAILLIASSASLGGAVSTLASEGTGSSFVFLQLFTTGSGSIYSFATFIAFLGPLAGIILGFDAVSNERTLGTLNRLASQPIYRDAIINAKFLAGATVIVLIVFTLGIYVSAVGLMMIGVPPGVEEVLRIAAFLVLSAVYIAVWLAFALLFSVLCRHAATAALACITIWLFLSLFMSLFASGIAGALFPLDGIEGVSNLMSNYQLELALNRISPYYLFSEAASTILNPSVRSIGIVTMSSIQGAVVGTLPFTQSLLLVWPHLVVMAALAAAGFAAAYIRFMRQEIRA
nr:ABC transporter permease subunit [uncultured Agathobaculum sp.]